MSVKRQWNAWILLAVMLSMTVLSSLHVHPELSATADNCSQCVNHIPHDGHLSATSQGAHQCVLCQFLTLTFVAAATVGAPTLCRRAIVFRHAEQRFCRQQAADRKRNRAPPSSFA